MQNENKIEMKTDYQQLLALAKTANARHEEALSLANQTKSLAAQAISSALLAGQALKKAREITSHGEWKAWLKIHINYSYETVTRYIELADPKHAKQLESCKTLRQAYVVLGILPDQQQQQSIYTKQRKQLTKNVVNNVGIHVSVNEYIECLAKVAYESYYLCLYTKGVITVKPVWENDNPEIHCAWKEAATAIYNAQKQN